jgi:hypothetical protein
MQTKKAAVSVAWRVLLVITASLGRQNASSAQLAHAWRASSPQIQVQDHAGLAPRLMLPQLINARHCRVLLGSVVGASAPGSGGHPQMTPEARQRAVRAHLVALRHMPGQLNVCCVRRGDGRMQQGQNVVTVVKLAVHEAALAEVPVHLVDMASNVNSASQGVLPILQVRLSAPSVRQGSLATLVRQRAPAVAPVKQGISASRERCGAPHASQVGSRVLKRSIPAVSAAKADLAMAVQVPSKS